MNVETVYPSDVEAAVEYAKSTNPNDKFGDTAFKFNHTNLRSVKGVKFGDFSINKQKENGIWAFVQLNLQFVNLVTKAYVWKEGSEVATAKVQFVEDSCKFTRKVKNADNTYTTKVEDYGRAKILINAAFKRIIAGLLKSKSLKNDNTKICSNIQTERKDLKSDVKVKLDPGQSIIRVEIPFESDPTLKQKVIKPESEPTIDIYDATKKIATPKPGTIPYHKATTAEGMAITYGNINDWLKPGSCVSGVDRMNGVAISPLGISLPSKLSVLIVKPSKGFKPDPSKIFSTVELASMGDAETDETVEAAIAPADSVPITEVVADIKDIMSVVINNDDDNLDDSTT
jgi:hypothetical protein